MLGDGVLGAMDLDVPNKGTVRLDQPCVGHGSIFAEPQTLEITINWVALPMYSERGHLGG